jgi:hypothetical protein
MARYSAVANVARNQDGVLRDVPMRETVGDWALPSLPLRLALTVAPDLPQRFATRIRPNWRHQTRLPRISAADLLSGGKPVCRSASTATPALHGRVVLIGFTASGLNDAKPTPVDPVMPGVEVMAEATEALIADSGIGTPPAVLKYAIAMLLIVLSTLAFYRGEPARTVDSVFIAANLALLASAFIGLIYFGFFFDIFASVGFVGMVFGVCRLYAGVQRGRAVGNGDYLPEFEPARDRWLAVARLRFVPDDRDDSRMKARLRREYRRRVKRFLYAGSDAVMLDGVVERKSWLYRTLADLTLLVWRGGSESEARAAAMHDLDGLRCELPDLDLRSPNARNVQLAFVCAEVEHALSVDEHALAVDEHALSEVEHALAVVAVRDERRRVRELVAAILAASTEWPLDRYREIFVSSNVSSGDS